MNGPGRVLCAVILAAITAGLGLYPARGAEEAPPAVKKVTVFVSILPQAAFVEAVGGRFVEVSVLVGPGQSPHTYEPTPRQIAALEGAALYFSIGVGFEEGFLRKVESMFPHLRVVDMAAGIPFRAMTEAEAEHGEEAEAHEAGHAEHAEHAATGTDVAGMMDRVHAALGRPAPHAEEPAAAEEHKEAHEEGHHHAAGERDPHVWLDPVLVKTLAENACEALVRAAPLHETEFRANLHAFAEKLDRTNERLAQALAPIRGRKLYVFHPAFGYFADRYGLEQIAVETAGHDPSAQELARFIESARADGVKVIFIQPQFSEKSAETVAEAVGGAVVPMDPLAGNYLQNLEEIASKVSAALGREP
ncbi:MAG: zinc ABC transporter substrate-binding protein [Planctomycetota bacterium]